jgi:FkbM family methyltransferase
VRTLVEKISRNRVIKRKLPKRFDSLPVFVSPDSALKFWSTNFEKHDPILFKMCEELVKPNDVVWDIGANLGMFSFAAASVAGATGKILAVEPDLFLANLMRKSVKAQSKNSQITAQVDVLPVVISDGVGVVKFNIASRGRLTNFLASTVGAEEAGGVRETVSVMSVTLDWLLDYYPAPNVVKIDVETAEDLVLKGAERLLSSIRPVILCEVSLNNKEKMNCVANIFKKNNYMLYDAEIERSERKQLEIPAFNTLAIPR